MIVLTCVCVPHPGQEEEARAAALEVTAASRDHEGLQGYLWNLEESTGELHLVEVHSGEQSVLNHIRLTDLTRLAAAGSFNDIKVYGAAPSPKLRETLDGFGEYQVFTQL
jgi:quinol monooxygenase YgiN